MKAEEARIYLELACETEVGKEGLRQLGYGAIVACPSRGDDELTVTAADRLRQWLATRYPKFGIQIF